ncbi:MAG: hydrogen gas-evolving membrane-bound hydrogenase subunit E [Oscillospiraceae bacterium]
MTRNKMKNIRSRFSAWLDGDHDLLADMEPYQEDESLFEREKSEPIKLETVKSVEHFQLRMFSKLYRFLSVIMCLAIIAVLLYTVSGMPRFGDAGSPTNNEVSTRYIESGPEETGAVNVVAGMILDYRAFDTLGETFVLFTAGSVVFILLINDGRHKTKREMEEDSAYNASDDIIVKITARLLIPVIVLFGLCVVINGHLSPGGGFSGGSIVGAGLTLYAIAFGFIREDRLISKKTLMNIMAAALLFYSVAKGYSFYMGANHFENGIPLGKAGNILSAGLILPLNIAVGIVVALTMYALYSAFRRGRL